MLLLALDCDLFIDAPAAADLLHKKEQQCLPDRIVVQSNETFEEILTCGASRDLRDSLSSAVFTQNSLKQQNLLIEIQNTGTQTQTHTGHTIYMVDQKDGSVGKMFAAKS